jgi:hypothetical protein
MHVYRLCDFALESNIPFNELPAAGPEQREFSFRLDLPSRAQRREPAWVARTRLANGRVWLAVGVDAASYVLRFPGLAEFRISSDTREIRAFRHRPMPLATLRHLLLDHVLPLALSRRARLVLHAGAVATPQGAIAFLGRTGMGKSTLSASLARAGFPLIADDFLLLREDENGPLAVPSYPGLRLWSDSAAEMFGHDAKAVPVAHYTHKRRCGVGRAVPFATDATRLSCVYVLASGRDVEHTRLTAMAPREAFVELARQTYRLDASDKELLSRQFTMHASVVRHVVFRRLEYPRRFAALHDVHQAIRADLAEAPGLS